MKWLKKKSCSHLFKASEMQLRDRDGNVKWICSKCGILFIEKCGLDILQNGKCDGNWGNPTTMTQAKEVKTEIEKL